MRYLVQMGECREIVEADTALESMANFFHCFDGDHEKPPDITHKYISAIQVVGEELFDRTSNALKRSVRDATHSEDKR